MDDFIHFCRRRAQFVFTYYVICSHVIFWHACVLLGPPCLWRTGSTRLSTGQTGVGLCRLTHFRPEFLQTKIPTCTPKQMFLLCRMLSRGVLRGQRWHLMMLSCTKRGICSALTQFVFGNTPHYCPTTLIL